MTENRVTAAYGGASGVAPYGNELSACVACGGSDIKSWADKSFSYTISGGVLPYHIVRCGDCGTGFLNPPPSAAFLAKIYAYSGHSLSAPVSLKAVLEAERKFPNSTVDADRMVRLAARLNRSSNKRVLDVGSGYGFMTRALRAAGFDTVSINPGEYENRIFEAMNGYRPREIMFDAYDSPEPFGVILLSQVLEHLIEPTKAVGRITRLLSPGGVFVCAVPNFRSISVAILGIRDNSCLWVPEHVNYFTAKGLARLVARHGLSAGRADYITRVRPDALSRRLGRLPGKSMIDAAVKYGQIPVAALANLLGRGLYINLYAVKP